MATATEPHTAPGVAVVDACECCGKPGVRYFNDEPTRCELCMTPGTRWAGPDDDVWACEYHAERLDRDPEADEADMRAGGGW